MTTGGHPTGGGPGAHDAEIEALIVDRYLESLLARRPAAVTDIPPGVEATARRLAVALPRFHPSFRFEEDLSVRLRAAAGPRLDGTIVRFPTASSTGPDRSGGRTFTGRPVVLGSVLTSAALSIAGAAFVAWRRRRPPVDPMVRAARAVARVRVA